MLHDLAADLANTAAGEHVCASHTQKDHDLGTPGLQHMGLWVLFRHFNLGWGRVKSTLWHFMRLQMQFINHLDVEVLPPYVPNHKVSGASLAVAASAVCCCLRCHKAAAWLASEEPHWDNYFATKQQRGGQARGITGVFFCLAQERKDPRLYAENVRSLMAEKLGAELSSHGLKEQQALKRAGVCVDLMGRSVYTSKPVNLQRVIIARGPFPCRA